MNDFEVMAEQNVNEGDKICFLISLNQVGESAKKNNGTTKNFQLKLLKSGEELASDFRAPQKIYEIIQSKWDVESAELRVPIFHANKKLPTGSRFKYELWVDYWKMGTSNQKLYLKQAIKNISDDYVTLNLENLVPGSAYQVKFSIVLFEGM